jgi:hypothetical protein
MLLRFETASYRHIQHSRLLLTQHFLASFYPVAQDKLVRAFARRLAKHLCEIRCTQPTDSAKIDNGPESVIWKGFSTPL